MTDQILLMTRPLADAQAFVARLDGAALRGVEVLYSPLIEIVQTAPCPPIDAGVGVIFSSANGVDAAPRGVGSLAFCVGEKTAQRARAKGYAVQIIAWTADHLVAQMAAHAGPKRLVHICGTHRRGDIAQRLTAGGRQVHVVEVYDQRLLPLTDQARHALRGEVRVTLPLFSPRTAAHFTTQAVQTQGTTALVLSSSVAETLDPAQFVQVKTVAQPIGSAMVRCIEKQLCDNRLS